MVEVPGPFRPMTVHEQRAWTVFQRIYGPIGPERLDLLVASQNMLQLELHRDPEKRAEPFSVADGHFLHWDGPPVQSTDEQVAVAGGIAEDAELYGG